jgi:phenylalanyl-tRNA synthetase beta chain
VVRAPYWRTDVNIADDVAEELARVTGYDKLEATPLAGAVPAPVQEPVRELRERLRDAAVAAGMQEIITYPLTTTDVLKVVAPPEKLEVHPPLRLENPMSSEAAVMRTSLRGSLLQAVASNLRRDRGTVALFEAAREFLTRPDDLPEERELIIGGLGGMRLDRWGQPGSEPVDFFDAKGLLEEAFERCGASVAFEAAEDYGLLRGRTAALLANGERAGVLGQVHPQVAGHFDIDGPVFLFEVDVARLIPAVKTVDRYTPLSRFPAVSQDIAVLVDASVSAARVGSLIRSSALVMVARLFDVYEGAPLPAGKRSLAFAVQFQSIEKTLTDAEVAEARNRIVRRLQHEVGAELRGG